MWQLLIGLGATLLIREITKGWGWNNEWKPSDIIDLPKEPGVYVLYSRSGKVIHVGSTGNLFMRLSSHPKRNRFHTFDWKEADSKDKAYEMEMRLQEELGYNGR